MTTDEARTVVLRCLAEIAPDADLDALPDDADMRRTLDLDSMDVFDLVAAIAEESGVEIPDREIPRLPSVGATAAFLAAAPSGG